MQSNLLYIILIVLTLGGPLARSFESKVRFYEHWLALWPAIASTGILFVVWDVWFTQLGVWGFNHDFVLGVFWAGLPLEEWLFFVAVPYACTFIYVCLNHFWPSTGWEPMARPIAAVASIGCFVAAYLSADALYSLLSFGLSGVCLAWAYVTHPAFLARFQRAYLVALIPFFLVNGVLTGSGLDAPVVWYNDAETLGFRLGTIPVEDAFYLQALLWLVIIQYEQRFAWRLLNGLRNRIRPRRPHQA